MGHFKMSNDDIWRHLDSIKEDLESLDDYAVMDTMRIFAHELYDRGYSIEDMIDVIKDATV